MPLVFSVQECCVPNIYIIIKWEKVYFKSNNCQDLIKIPHNTPLRNLELWNIYEFATTLLQELIPFYYTYKKNGSFEDRLRSIPIEDQINMLYYNVLGRIYIIQWNS